MPARDGAPSPAPRPERAAGGLLAVIVGIDGYADESVPELTCATNDAVAIAEVLRKAWPADYLRVSLHVWPPRSGRTPEGWGVPMPADARGVTREGILGAVRSSAAEAGPRDTLLVYLSGHGALIGGEPCLLVVADAATGAGVEALPIPAIQAAADRCPTDRKVLILDCCQTPEGGSGGLVDSFGRLAQGWSVLASCSPGEASFEDLTRAGAPREALEQGLFTAAVIRGLRGGADVAGLGHVTLFDLAHSVCGRVHAESAVRLNEAAGVRDRAGRPCAATRQHPFLLPDLTGGARPHEIVLARVKPTSKHDLRRTWPSAAFPRYWASYLTGGWPVDVTRRLMVQVGGALLYGAAMLFAVVAAGGSATGAGLALPIGVGLVSAVLWWAMVPFAVASNEDRWHGGGYAAGLAYVFWHTVVLGLFCGLLQGAGAGAEEMSRASVSLGLVLFLLLFAVIAYECNAVHTIIALAELLRPDERGEMREAIRVFRDFRLHLADVDTNNLIAMVSAHPVVYHAVTGLVTLFVGWDALHSLRADAPVLWAILLRDASALVLVAWQSFWYVAAFKHSRMEVYKA